MNVRVIRAGLLLVILGAAATGVRAQQQGPPPVVSPQVSADRHVTFRLRAPQATTVKVSGGDMPAVGQGAAMTKGADGVWETTLGPVDPGYYRYNFNVDGVSVIDPVNPSISESNNNVWSLVSLPGSDFMDTAKTTPHGAVASIDYWSTTLNRFRRMHVYTPPGYEHGTEKYPVFFLLHGAGDSDEAWTSVGRAGIIVDNLIAAKKAKPMIIVMPAGHTQRGAFNAATPMDEFQRDFLTDVVPYVDGHYRVLTGRANRAIAGLSMGGLQTLDVAFAKLDAFAYVGVYSSGLFRDFARPRPTGPGAPPAPAPPPPTGPSWEERNRAALDNASLKSGLKLVWFATGKDDFLLDTTHKTVDLLKAHGFTVEYQETSGGHTWINWRNYLAEFAPRLFQSR
jgi:enterochelin esterase family protein